MDYLAKSLGIKAAKSYKFTHCLYALRVRCSSFSSFDLNDLELLRTDIQGHINFFI